MRAYPTNRVAISVDLALSRPGGCVLLALNHIWVIFCNNNNNNKEKKKDVWIYSLKKFMVGIEDEGEVGTVV